MAVLKEQRPGTGPAPSQDSLRAPEGAVARNGSARRRSSVEERGCPQQRVDPHGSMSIAGSPAAARRVVCRRLGWPCWTEMPEAGTPSSSPGSGPCLARAPASARVAPRAACRAAVRRWVPASPRAGPPSSRRRPRRFSLRRRGDGAVAAALSTGVRPGPGGVGVSRPDTLTQAQLAFPTPPPSWPRSRRARTHAGRRRGAGGPIMLRSGQGSSAATRSRRDQTARRADSPTASAGFAPARPRCRGRHPRDPCSSAT